MPRDKRKTRLEKQGGEFLGFGAFASSPSSAAADATAQQQWSPVYTGSDQQLHLVFRRIAQKRDGVTKAKALGELREYFEKEDVSKKDQVTALSHLLFVYHSKLGYDDFSSVRAASVECLQAAYERLPKAWKTMVLEQQGGEVWGSLWCLQADAAAEVRSAAAACCQRLQQQQQDESPPDHNGVVKYVTRLLGYDRPRNLHDALFARKNTASDSKQTSMSESERDQMEERFDRIVGTALTGMELWIRQHPDTDYQDCFPDETLWKTLSSSRSSFRRRTYALLAACCQHAKGLVYTAAEGLSEGLTNVLTIEKEPVNVPSLLEVLLLYISQFPEGKPWESLDAKLVTKNIGKMLKKACHGATAREWGPTMLPLLAALPDDSLTLQRQLLSNLWAGHDVAIGASDAMFIVSTVAECSSFFLLRKQPTTIAATVAQEVADYWLKSLSFYLGREAVSNSARDADRALLLCLSRGLSQLDMASLNRTHSAIYSIKDVFWSDLLLSHVRKLHGSEVDRRLALLLRETGDHQAKQSDASSSDDNQSLTKAIAREVFWTTLRRFQGESGSIPDEKAYDLMIASLQYCGASDIFDSHQGDSMAMDQFIMNDLLRWLVIHTSQHPLPGYKGRRGTLVTKDFTLLRLCFSSVAAERRRSLWESVVREVVAAKCDLRLFSNGLAILAERENDGPSWGRSLQCTPLHDFATQVGRDAVVEHHKYVSRLVHDEILEGDVDQGDYKDEASKTEMFLRACAGLGSHYSLSFIQKPVVDAWISALSEDMEDHVISMGSHVSTDNPLLMTVISLCEAKGTLIDSQDKISIMMIAWRHGGGAWSDHALAWLSENTDSPQAAKQLASDASNELRAMLRTSSSDRVETILMCHVWSDRAFRLLGLQDLLDEQHRFSCPFLENVGLMDVSEWLAGASKEDSLYLDRLYLSLIYLLEQITDKRKRLDVLRENAPKVLVKILLSMSDISEATFVDPVRREDWRVMNVINLFDRDDLRETRTLEDWCEEAIAVLESTFTHETDSSIVKRSISVLSEILGCMFHPVSLDSDSVEPEDIEEGQMLWYVADLSNDTIREEAVVAKIHTDDFPRLYFTIHLEDNGKKQERQTVSSRLRTSPAKLPEERMKEETEKVGRQRISCLLAERLLKPRLVSLLETNDLHCLNAIAEIINLVVSQSGLYEKAGIGSIQFDIFRWMSSIESKVVEAFGDDSVSEVSIQFLQALTLALGYGHITPFSRLNFRLVGFKPNALLSAMVGYFEQDTHRASVSPKLTEAMLKWLSISIGQLDDADLCVQSNRLCLELAAAYLQTETSRRETYPGWSSLVIAMRAVLAVLNVEVTKNIESEDQGNEDKIFKEIVEAFIRSPDMSTDATLYLSHDDLTEPVWAAPVTDFLKVCVRRRKEIIAKAALSAAEDLVRLLFDRQKRWFAFSLLCMASAMGKPLYTEDECEVGESTVARQRQWEEDLEQEEKEELDDDIFAVCQWLPRALMEDLESWVNDNEEKDWNEEDMVGCMLSWLILLSFVEASAAVDILNRGSFSSYIEKSRAATVILSLALDHIDFGNNRQSKRVLVATVEDVRNDRTKMDVSTLAPLVLFRATEVFPSLTRKWWEEDCPRALTSPLCQFVEANVAPDILRHELDRIKDAPDFDEMNVNGSVVSREVIATYLQDECQLSVTISIPPTFPLRNVEVDSSKTLGVPEKRLKRWTLQIRQMLNTQDGTLKDALMLWKQNVDQEFAGVEPCVICYSVLSVKTHDLPNLECKQCKNVFHSGCLYKWFHSSGKSQCVLCQQPWSGSRIR